MPTELVIQADYQGGMKVTAGDGEHTVTMDYPLEPGQAVAGLTPLKLLLASLTGCIGNTVPMLLAKGHRVRVLDCLLYGADRTALPDREGFSLVRGDIRDRAAAAGDPLLTETAGRLQPLPDLVALIRSIQIRREDRTVHAALSGGPDAAASFLRLGL